MKYISCMILVLISLLSVGCSEQDTSSQQPGALKIGIIIPIAHSAMGEITAGFIQTLSSNLKQPVHFKTLNAQGDINLQRAMITQLKNQDTDLFVPIGKQASEMTAAMIKDKPILGLAALLPQSTRKHSNVALVNDEITPAQIMQFIHAVYPHKKHFTIVYANNDKMIPQVNEAISTAKTFGITMDKRMIATLPELYSVANTLPETTEGIIVLKDVFVASGMPTLANIANNRHIPLIAADDGSVQNGAGFGLGVREYQIGVAGANVAKQILIDNVSPSTLPILQMTNLSVFINKKALSKQHQKLRNIVEQAHQYGYNIIDVVTLPNERQHD